MDASASVTLHTGNTMPVLGLGTWLLTNDTVGTLEAAHALGYRMIDTAADYGTQPGIGEAFERGVLPRDRIYLVLKVEETDDAYQATQAYLREVSSDYADLVLIHRPPAGGLGRKLWEGLVRAKQEGLARDIGVSNYSAELIDELVEARGEVPAVNQIEWTPFGHSRRMLEYCNQQNIVLQAYSPLTRAKRLDDARLADIAKGYGKTPAQLLIRWNLQIGVVPLPKANQRSHLEEDIDVFDFEIGDEDMARLGELNERYSALGVLPYD